MRPIRPSLESLNHTLPSAPPVMAPAYPVVNSVTAPAVLMRPILPMPGSVNQRFPSGPFVMNAGPALNVRPAKDVMEPPGVMRLILSLSDSVNHRLPSGPVVMSAGADVNTLLTVLNSVTTPAGVILSLIHISEPTRQAEIS